MTTAFWETWSTEAGLAALELRNVPTSEVFAENATDADSKLVVPTEA